VIPQLSVLAPKKDATFFIKIQMANGLFILIKPFHSLILDAKNLELGWEVLYFIECPQNS
jgi:hypothetical protein